MILMVLNDDNDGDLIDNIRFICLFVIWIFFISKPIRSKTYHQPDIWYMTGMARVKMKMRIYICKNDHENNKLHLSKNENEND